MDLDQLQDYLKNPRAFEEIGLVQSGVIKFHWSNWDRLLDQLHFKIKKGESVRSVDEIGFCLEEYRNIPVWFKNKQGSVKSNVYELYSYFLDPRLRELWFELNEETLISFSSGSGPYIRLQSMRWFDFNIYKSFIYGKLLNNMGITKRDFRISVDIPMEFEFRDSVQESIPAKIIQVSKRGMLINISSKSDLQTLERMEHIYIRSNLAAFSKVQGKKALDEIFTLRAFKGSKAAKTEFRLRDNILDLGNNRNNSYYSNGKEYFLFINFDDLKEVGESKRHIPESMRTTVEKFEEMAISQLKAA